MAQSVLIVAFDFPPAATSSGLQRALKTTRYLCDFGWRPTVLTVHPRAYDNTNPSQLAEIPDDVAVYRAFGFDARRLFSFRNRYPGFLAWPDPWLSWWPDAVRLGRAIIRKHQPQAIWSTFPFNTTNLVAHSLAKSSGLPWIADLRDPITLDGYPPDPVRFRLARKIEEITIRQSARTVFTAEYTRQIYIERYPTLSARSVLIPNGFDESNFPADVQSTASPAARRTFLHSGSLQPKARNPRALFEALRKLKQAGVATAANMRVVFRASGFDKEYSELASELGISDLVEFQGHLPYDEALREMMSADVLLVFQGTPYNHAVPAKLYEYLYARKPILGLVDKQGETFRVMTDIGITELADINEPQDIAGHLSKLIGGASYPSAYVADDASINRYSRRNQVRHLADILRQVVAERGHISSLSRIDRPATGRPQK